jgi:hypothetical protein
MRVDIALLTGKDNYQDFQDFLVAHHELGYSNVDVVTNPNLILTNSDF